MNRRWLIFGAVTLAGVAALWYARNWQAAAENQFAQEAQLAFQHAEHVRRTTVNFVERTFPAGRGR